MTLIESWDAYPQNLRNIRATSRALYEIMQRPDWLERMAKHDFTAHAMMCYAEALAWTVGDQPGARVFADHCRIFQQLHPELREVAANYAKLPF